MFAILPPSLPVRWLVRDLARLVLRNATAALLVFASNPMVLA